VSTKCCFGVQTHAHTHTHTHTHTYTHTHAHARTHTRTHTHIRTHTHTHTHTHRRGSLSPVSLRAAMAEAHTIDGKFRVSEMGDAVEFMENLLRRIEVDAVSSGAR
jgi:hypothetical protein